MNDDIKELICTINDLESYDDDWARTQVKKLYGKMRRLGYEYDNNTQSWVYIQGVKNVNAN